MSIVASLAAGVRSLTAATIAAIALSLAFSASPALAAKADIYAKGGVAAKGYDVVAFFTDGMPVKGSPEFATEWKGVEWRFASAEHRDAFLADPERYAPQYGGYCAWAVAQGKTAPGDPMFWRIVDGKLYLNFNGKVQKDWEEDIPGNIQKADGNWPGVLE